MLQIQPWDKEDRVLTSGINDIIEGRRGKIQSQDNNLED